MTAKCTHSRYVPGYYAPNPYHCPREWELGGWDTGPTEWVDGYDDTTFVDVDLRRMKCTQCDEIKYYSNRAKQHFAGVEHHPDIAESHERYIR
jgi:hypothetical protein